MRGRTAEAVERVVRPCLSQCLACGVRPLLSLGFHYLRPSVLSSAGRTRNTAVLGFTILTTIATMFIPSSAIEERLLAPRLGDDPILFHYHKAPRKNVRRGPKKKEKKKKKADLTDHIFAPFPPRPHSAIQGAGKVSNMPTTLLFNRSWLSTFSRWFSSSSISHVQLTNRPIRKSARGSER